MVRITRRDVEKKFDVSTTSVHEYELKELKGFVLEFPAGCFHAGSAVVMPDPPRPSGLAADAPAPDMLSRVMTAIRHAKQNPSQKLIVHGLGGAAGEDTAFSLLRAKAVRALVEGNKSAWNEACLIHHTVADYQRILQWIARVWAFDCNPGSVNGTHDAATAGAVKRFKAMYNTEYSASLADDDLVDVNVWGAFFDVYEDVLAVYFGLDDRAKLSGERSALKFVDDGKKSVGCGAGHPTEPVRAAASFTGERVELTFYDPGEEPQLRCHPDAGKCKPMKCEVHNPIMYRWTVIPPAPAPAVPTFKIALKLGDIDRLFPDIVNENAADPGVRQRLQAAGWLYAPLNHTDINTIAAEAWQHFKDENQTPADGAAVAKLKDLLKTTVVDQGKLPAPGAFTRLRVPGTWCTLDGNFFGTNAAGHRYAAEKDVYDNNPSLGLVPVLAVVEVKRHKWGKAGGQRVHLQLVKPDVPAAQAAEPLRSTTTTSNSTDTSVTPNVAYTFTMTGSPKKYVDDTRALDAVVADDPQVDNVHNSRGGKRGNPTAGTSRTTNLLEHNGARLPFHTALNLKFAVPSSHPHAVAVETNDKGEGAVVFMPSWMGGDRYKFRAFLDPLRGAASDPTKPDAVKAETGTLVVWRILRVSKYYRWDYPAASTAAQKLRTGGTLDAFDFAGVISTEYKKAWLDVTLEREVGTRHDITQAEWAAARAYALGRVTNPGTSQLYDLPTLLPATDATSNNDNPALLRYLTRAQYDAAPKTAPAPPGGWPSAVADPAYWNNMAIIFHAVKDEFLHYFTRNARSGVCVIQCPTMSSFDADGVAGTPGTPFSNSGWGTWYRGCYVTYGQDIYANFPYSADRNCLHEMGHVLFGVHQYTRQVQVNALTGNTLDGHDYHDLCIMGYMPCSGGFCGRCVLSQAGWDTSKLAVNSPGP